MMNYLINAMEKGHIPDPAVRFGIRKLCKVHLNKLESGTLDEEKKNAQKYLEHLKDAPLTVHTNSTNNQHDELPSDFFIHVLGKYLKYSSGYWSENTKTLNEAEYAALDISIKRAHIEDGMRILELGCGWGSLTLEMAQRFPGSKIVAISNSHLQKEFIEGEAAKRKLTNITIISKDMSHLESLAVDIGTFDRVISIEMFEHFKNYEVLLKKISEVLSPQGKLFVHIITHKDYSYPFETKGDYNWMGKYFFTDGQMPSHNLLYSFQRDLVLDKSWAWSGTHYEKTSNAWLARMDENKEYILDIFKHTYGNKSTEWFNRWRVFFMSCAELFGYEGGGQWGISHYLFSKR